MKYDKYVDKNGVELLIPKEAEKYMLEMNENAFYNTMADLILENWGRLTPEQRAYLQVASERKSINIQLPYILNEKILMYGGYSKWNNEISELLPNITVIDANVDIDVNILYNYRTVYLCERAISNKVLCNMKKILIKQGISYSYFDQLDVKKTARKVADFDMFIAARKS